MFKIRVNFGPFDTEERKEEEEIPEYIHPGWYTVKVEGVERKEGISTDYLQWEFSVSTVPGFKLFFITALHESALWRLQEFFFALYGIRFSGVVEIKPEITIGQALEAKVVDRVYKGRVRNEISEFRSVVHG